MAITGQEFKILELAGLGYTDSSICFELGLSKDTLGGNWKKILAKIGAASKTEAVAKFASRLTPGETLTDDQLETRLLSEVSDHLGTEARELAQRNLLEAITDASLCYINGRQNVRQVYSRILDGILSLTQSQYGVVGEIHYESGMPYLGEYALTSLGWDAATQANFESTHKDRLLFRHLDTLFGEVIASREVLIVNDAPSDVRSSGPIMGHPEMRSFLGIPVYNGLEMVGLIAIANRPAGYSKETVEFLKPIISTCANITVAWRLEIQRRNMERKLDESTVIMRTLVERTPSAVLYENADRRLEFINARFGRLFGIEAAPAQVVGIDASLVVRHSKRLFSDPERFHDRVEDLIAGQESFYGEMIEMADGRLFLRDFVVVRSADAVCGYFWHYREIQSPFDE